MAEIEAKILERLDRLASDKSVDKSWHWMSAFVVTFFCGLWLFVFVTSTKPADVLQSTSILKSRIEVLQKDIVKLDIKVSEVSKRLNDILDENKPIESTQ